MPPLSVLIKPASSNCNLKCKYCFYHSIAENRNINSYGFMTHETLEAIVKRAFSYGEHICTFAFQGGEPTLSGIDFYRKLISLVEKYNVNNIKVNYALQTNGMVINDEWAKFLAKNHFLVGLSLDGPKDIHDANRVDYKDNGSFSRVMNTVDLFNKYGVEYNILFVVSAYVARHVRKIYNFFKKNNFKYLQFIPCLDPLNEEPGGRDYSLKSDRYASFLKNLFDLWYEDIIKGETKSIRYFDNLLGIFMGYRPEECDMLGKCQCQFVIEADGGVYPCDFYVLDEWCMGNIKEKEFDELRKGHVAESFINVSKHKAPECEKCKWLNICRSGCRRHKEPFVDGKPALNRYCSAYADFYEYASERLYKMSSWNNLGNI